MKKWIPFLMLFICSCQSKKLKVEELSMRDSLAQMYNGIIRGNPYGDTTSMDYQILKSYIRNDTRRMEHLIKEFKFHYHSIHNNRLTEDSFLFPSKFIQNEKNEMYKFLYQDSWCPYASNFTIILNNDTCTLEYFEYENTTWHSKYSLDSIKINKHVKKVLTKKETDDFYNKIYVSNFWSVNEFDYVIGCDGADLHIIGWHYNRYIGKKEVKHIYRYQPGCFSIGELLFSLLKNVGNETGCAEYNYKNSK
jgi:hypothetical protein